MLTLPLTAPDSRLFFSKHDANDPRLGDLVLQSSGGVLNRDQIPELSETVIFGYPDDEGIKNNGGRVGAAGGPTKIREFLYKMTPSLENYHMIEVADLGDFQRQPGIPDLRDFQQEIAQNLVPIYQADKRCLSFGGGHDYGYCDTSAFVQAFGPESIVINFDAHLDVRPSEMGINSGTPFYRLLTQHQTHFFEVGIQDQCNSRKHLEWLEDREGRVLTMRHIQQRGLMASLHDALSKIPNVWERKTFISLDIDCLCQSLAPGCSQSFVGGLEFTELKLCLEYLYRQLDVRGLGIYEVSPILDIDNRTSKTAALLAHQFLFS